jgi:Tfp pilus assembly protein PilP
MKRPTHGSFQAWALILAACLPMAGCGRSDEPSVQDWITQRRAQAQAAPSTVTEPTAFRAQPYLEGAALDPFNGQKLTQALRQDSAQNSSAALIQPEQARPRQALEAFALDSMTLVGNLMQRGERVALVKPRRSVAARIPVLSTCRPSDWRASLQRPSPFHSSVRRPTDSWIWSSRPWRPMAKASWCPARAS